MMRAARNILKTIFMVLFFIFYYLFQTGNMFFEKVSTSSWLPYAPLMLFVVLLVYVLIYRDNRRMNKYITPLYVFEIYILIISLFYSLIFPLSSNLLFFILFIPLLSISFIRRLVSNDNDSGFILGYFVVFVGIFIFYMQNHYVEVFEQNDNVTNAAYTLLYMLPLLLCTRNKILAIISVILTVIAVFLSLKRGSISILSVSLLIYAYILFFKGGNKQNRLIRILLIILGLLIFTQTIYFFDDLSNNTIRERFVSLEDDRGSGRIDVFRHTISMISRSHFLELLFGHGWDMVRVDSNLNLSAHNDHLEILYDFGLVSYIFFLIFYIRLVQFNVSLIKKKSHLAAPMAMSLVIFILASFISHIVIYPYYMTTFVVTWSYIVTIDNRQMINSKAIIYEKNNVSLRHPSRSNQDGSACQGVPEIS